jgi:hypothetical protein
MTSAPTYALDFAIRIPKPDFAGQICSVEIAIFLVMRFLLKFGIEHGRDEVGNQRALRHRLALDTFACAALKLNKTFAK